ncbi:pentapeptide repeat-containing protein [Vasconcelosia minhoensis]|nr:pentapeptide repeat-containing protein [Romeria gracilis]
MGRKVFDWAGFSYRRLRVWLVGVWLVGVMAIALFASASAIAVSGLPPLTGELLAQRLAAPVQREGKPMIDLSGLTIDLRPEQEAFATQFYRQLQDSLNGGQRPPGLDLSGSLIQGSFDLQRLGLRVPTYGEIALGGLDEAVLQQLQQDQRRLGQLGQLSRSLLLEAQPTKQNLFIFQVPLRLAQTTITGQLNAADLYFLGRVEAQDAVFAQAADWRDTRFARSVSFTDAQFQQESRFRNSLFFARSRFNQVSFGGPVSFQGAEFRQTANFNDARFDQAADFSRSQWLKNADFAQSRFAAATTFARGQFSQSLFLTEARFAAPVTFRQAQFQQPVNLRSASIQRQADFGDARFGTSAYINVADLEFNADEAQILGSPGQIGRAFSVPTLGGNETVLRNLVRNFRLLEQIGDANQLEYMTERLRLRQLRRRIRSLDLNQATAAQLQRLGLSPKQSEAILARRQQQPFVSRADLLSLDTVDLAAYVKVRDRVTAGSPPSPLARLVSAGRWLSLGLLLLLSGYGTRFGLTLGSGLIAIALFGLMFWVVDRCRRRRPTPLLPERSETAWILASFVLLLSLGLVAVLRSAAQPGWTLACIGLVTLPIPVGLIGSLYRRGRYHDLLEQSYFVENGSLRELQLLIARLPVIPKFPFYRERYTPLPTDRRWNWLNYYDFSLNNWLKFGFNDLRLRDRAVPGLISALVWYQWSLGILYVILLLWTLSRTIPGLNLLLYF